LGHTPTLTRALLHFAFSAHPVWLGCCSPRLPPLSVLLGGVGLPDVGVPGLSHRLPANISDAEP
jgi:hypothetical protein